jgi:acyl-CoA synthetase (AMP-forming)/AMP-acid ligase II
MTVSPIEALMQQAQSRPENTAFIFHEDVWTYRRLAHEAESVARGLAASGVKPGDRVVLHMINRPEMLVAYYACTTNLGWPVLLQVGSGMRPS